MIYVTCNNKALTPGYLQTLHGIPPAHIGKYPDSAQAANSKPSIE